MVVYFGIYYAILLVNHMCTTMKKTFVTFYETLDSQRLPDTVEVENVHLSHSLMTLAYKVNEKEVLE